ncbi:MAG: hypothetical protein AAGJ53_05005 [Pseudomonadota bacterium]
MAATMKAGALAGATGLRCDVQATTRTSTNIPKKAARVTFGEGEEQTTVTLKGRTLWALRQLLAAGADGVTPIERVGPRWSDYVFKLRRRGISVETIREPHEGAFPGAHGRYVLRTKVVVEEAGNA